MPGYSNRGPPAGQGSGPRELFDIICSDCNQPGQVPFKPREGSPVYCRNCYSKHRPQRRF